MKLNKNLIVRFLSIGLIAAALILSSCAQPSSGSAKTYTLNYENAKAGYTAPVIITTKNISESAADCYAIDAAANTITFNAATSADGTNPCEVIITGYFKGKVINKVADLVITLNGAYLENENEPALYAEAKTEISAKKDTVNYIVTTGTVDETNKTGAVSAPKDVNLEFGGKGSCYIIGNVNHGVKADKCKFKGSAKYFIQGTSSGSAVNCGKEFNIEADKTVTVSFYNAKNGIKADNAITIASGTLNFYGNSTALKTDKRTDEEIAAGKAPRTITLSGCTITTDGVKTLYETNTYTKGAGVTIN